MTGITAMDRLLCRQRSEVCYFGLAEPLWLYPHTMFHSTRNRLSVLVLFKTPSRKCVCPPSHVSVLNLNFLGVCHERRPTYWLVKLLVITAPVPSSALL